MTDRATTLSAPLIGALLRMPWETVRERMLDGLHERGYTDLIQAHLTVLQYPGPDNVRPADLAVRTRMSKQALNYLLSQLQQFGYLTREPDNDDLRFRRIKLTARGHAAMSAIRQIVTEVETEWEASLGREPFAQLRQLLEQLRDVTTSVDPLL